MKRRSFLGFLGAGAAVAATGAAALPKVASPVDLAKTGGREVSAKGPFIFNDGVLTMNECRIGVITAGILRYPNGDYIDLGAGRIVLRD